MEKAQTNLCAKRDSIRMTRIDAEQNDSHACVSQCVQRETASMLSRMTRTRACHSACKAVSTVSARERERDQHWLFVADAWQYVLQQLSASYAQLLFTHRPVAAAPRFVLVVTAGHKAWSTAKHHWLRVELPLDVAPLPYI
jgi:hypothetical protein